VSYFAPAGTPITLLDLARGLSAGLLDRGCSEDLSKNLSALSGCQHAWLMSSGRAAMTVIGNAMRVTRGNVDKDEIIVPAYTCYSVPAAFARAGLKVRLCDIDPQTLNYDMDALSRTDCTRVLGIVTANLYGLPNDLPAIEGYARDHGIYMLDDAAQALGASIAGKAVGGFGDAGLYSFDKGKNIATIQGGAIVAHTGALADGIRAGYQSLPKTPFKESTLLVAKLAAYTILLRPTAYGLIRRMPFLGLGQTPYELECLIAKFSAVLAGVGRQLFLRLAELTSARRRNAQALLEMLSAEPSIEIVNVLPRAEPVYARLPVIVRQASQRDALINALDKMGIGATGSYPAALCDVPQAASIIRNGDEEFKGARRVASSIVTLPTHPYCPDDMPARVHAALSGVSVA